DTAVYLYSWDGSKLTQTGKLDSNNSAISCLAFSPDGGLLAVGDSGGKLMLYNVTKKELITGRWSGHSGRINALAFHPGGKHAVSGALDTNIFIWSVEKPLRKASIPNACMGGVNMVQWIGENTIASAGADASIRTWEVVLPS
ncbi:WD40 repeat-like protein, partial [Serendipita sp. 400]